MVSLEQRGPSSPIKERVSGEFAPILIVLDV